jgi:hypothetical protein
MKLGKYRHFKGKVYDVLGVAIHTETNEELVVYSDGEKFFVRPKVKFFEEVDGKPRFEFVE